MVDFPFVNSLFLLLACMLLAPYVFGPILIRIILRQSAAPEVDTFSPDDPRLPPEVADHFREVSEALVPLGFEVVEGLALPKQAPKVKAVGLLLVNRATADIASALIMYGDLPQGTRVQTAYVELVTRFRDGTGVLTHNTKVLGAFPPRPHLVTGRFPMVKETGRLYQLHRALVERHGSSAGAVLRLDAEFHGDAAAYVSTILVEQLEEQIGTGYMYRAPGGKWYRPTWKGALLMTWGLLWPFKAIRAQRRAHEARQLMAELEQPEDGTAE
jgi:hypothetical protein